MTIQRVRMYKAGDGQVYASAVAAREADAKYNIQEFITQQGGYSSDQLTIESFVLENVEQLHKLLDEYLAYKAMRKTTGL